MRDQSPTGRATGAVNGTVLLRPWTRPVAGPGRPEIGRQRRVGAQLHRGVGRRRVVGEAPATQHDVGARVLEGGALELGPPGGQHRVSGRDGVATAAPRRPHPTPDRPPPGSTATPCSGTGGPAAHPRRRAASVPAPGRPLSSAARRSRMPGVQNPHWLAPVATKASAQRSRCAAGIPSRVVTLRPATRRTRGHAGHPGQAVDPHGATATLTLGATAVLDRAAPELLAQHVEEGDAVGDGDLAPVQDEGDQGDRSWCCSGDGTPGRAPAQLKEEPQPQVRVALGFVMWNPASWSPSL